MSDIVEVLKMSWNEADSLLAIEKSLQGQSFEVAVR
jgi:hypothetical protein